MSVAKLTEVLMWFFTMLYLMVHWTVVVTC